MSSAGRESFNPNVVFDLDIKAFPEEGSKEHQSKKCFLWDDGE